MHEKAKSQAATQETQNVAKSLASSTKVLLAERKAKREAEEELERVKMDLATATVQRDVAHARLRFYDQDVHEAPPPPPMDGPVLPAAAAEAEEHVDIAQTLADARQAEQLEQEQERDPSASPPYSPTDPDYSNDEF